MMKPTVAPPAQPLAVERQYNWRLLYAIVLGELALLIALFVIFTRAFD